MLGAKSVESDTDGTLIITTSNCETITKIVSIMDSGDKTGIVARLKTPAFSRHGRIFSRRDRTSLVDKVGIG